MQIFNVEYLSTMSEMERRKSSRINCFSLRLEEGGFLPVWQFDNSPSNMTPGLLLNLSNEGCSLVVQHDAPYPPARCVLHCFDEHQTELISFETDCKVMWVREHYSIDDTMLGVELKPVGQSEESKLRSLLTHIRESGCEYLRCDIEDISDRQE